MKQIIHVLNTKLGLRYSLNNTNGRLDIVFEGKTEPQPDPEPELELSHIPPDSDDVSDPRYIPLARQLKEPPRPPPFTDADLEKLEESARKEEERELEKKKKKKDKEDILDDEEDEFKKR